MNCVSFLRFFFLEAVEATFTRTEFCAYYSALEALTIFLETSTFLAVASLVVESSVNLNFRLESVRVPI